MATFRLSVHQITWGHDLDLALKEISEFGYRGAETFANVVDDFAGREDELRAKFDDAGVRLTALYGGGRFWAAGEEAETIEWNMRIADFLASMGADRFVLGPSAPRLAEGTSDQQFQTMATVANEIGERCLELGVIAGIHPHWATPVQEESEIHRIFDMVDTDKVKMVLDPAHIAKAGADPLAICERYASIISYVHIKDYSPELETPDANKPQEGRAPTLAFFSELGKGIVDTPGFVQVLREADYDGWLTIELDRSQTTPRESLANNTQYLREVLNFDIGDDNQ